MYTQERYCGLEQLIEYANWFNTWVRPRFNDTVQALLPEHARELIPNIESPFDGEACYLFRCSLLHQGRTITLEANILVSYLSEL
jgi:hypothetical protein